MNKNLLIIDDEVMLLKGMKDLLEDYADQIFTAENGKLGLEIFQKESIQCIVCDINMPVMNGVELIKEIRQINSTVPFIFYTGHGSHELMLEAAKYGAFDFLNKPFLDGLEEIVQRALGLQSKEQASTSETLSDYAKMLQDLED